MVDLERLSRRRVVAALGGGAAIALASTRAGAMHARAIPGDGPVLGMSQSDWMASMGPGEESEGDFGETVYAYGAQHGMLYVTFRAFSDGAFATYLEFRFFSEGMTYDKVDPIARSFMPADAAATDAYLAPPTPGGPTAIASWRYESESLAAVHPGVPKNFLSMWMQERGEDGAWLVSSIHLMAGEIMQ